MRGVAKRWWSLLSCAVFTIIGILAAQYRWSGSKVVAVSCIAACALFFVASYLAFGDVYYELLDLTERAAGLQQKNESLTSLAEQLYKENKKHRELEQSKPEIVARWAIWSGDFMPAGSGMRLFLRNTGQSTAINLSVLPLSFTIPETRRNPAEPTDWIVTFQNVDTLSVGAEDRLEYRIAGMGPLQQDITWVLREFVGPNGRKTFPLAIVFSHTSDPLRQWHGHYECEFNFLNSTISAKFIGIEEVIWMEKCSLC